MTKQIDKLNWQQLLKSGDRIFIGSHAATPTALIDNLISNARQLHDIEVVQVYSLADNKWADAEYQQLFKVNALFIGGDQVRRAVAEGRADYTPCFMSDIPSLFSDGIIPLDAALIMVSPADEHGYHSLGVSVDIVSAAARAAKKVIAQVNPSMPITYGQAFIHRDQISAYYYAEQPLVQMPPVKLDAVTERIGQYVSLLVEDGATIQIGVGKMCDAVLYSQYYRDHYVCRRHARISAR